MSKFLYISSSSLLRRMSRLKAEASHLVVREFEKRIVARGQGPTIEYNFSIHTRVPFVSYIFVILGTSIEERAFSTTMTGDIPTSDHSSSIKAHIGIVGAGISGLRCADILLQNGFQVTILEARDRIGGKVCYFILI